MPMTVAQMVCEREHAYLSEFACLSENTKGREQLSVPIVARHADVSASYFVPRTIITAHV